MKKKFVLAPIFIFVFSLQVFSQEKESRYVDCVNTTVPKFPARILVLNHLVTNLKIDDHVEAGQSAGTMEPYPKVISEEFDESYKKAVEFYSNGKFEDSIQLLSDAVKKEPKNPFLLNFLAKSLYAANRKKESLDYYKKLLIIIDSEEKRERPGFYEKSIIDLWFMEAYWKISTLYMDSQDFELAYYYNRKMLDSFSFAYQKYNRENLNYFIAALSYLTEATYFLNRTEENRFYLCETFKLDPNNRYILEFILPENFKIKSEQSPIDTQ